MTDAQPRMRMRARRPNAFVEVALTAPVFAVYQLGLLLLDVQNGADWLTGTLLRVLQWNRLAYAAFVALISAGMLFVARRAHRTPERVLGRIFAESAALAILLLVVATALGRVIAVNGLGFSSDSLVGRLVLSAGAGFHEELLFRVVLFEGGVRLFEARGRTRERSTLVLAVLTSVLFAIAHHLGPYGEPWVLSRFVLRFVSGLYFCAILRLRGFATAVYTHTTYDVLVLVVLG